MSQTVLQWAGLYQQASQETGIPASTLAGLVQIESGGRPGLTSSADAQGITQFIPGTARQYSVDVRPGHERSQVFGAARYLRDLGYADDPRKALASYNAGPGNFRAGLGYADNVLTASKTYRSLDGAAGLAGATATGTLPTSTTGGEATAGTTGGGLLNADRKRALLSGLLWLGLVGLGVTLATLGAARLTGARSAATTLAQAIPATRAAKAIPATAKAKAA